MAGAALELTWRQVIARRLARSHLLEPAPSLVEAVRVPLLQAQVLSAAAIGACIRTRDATAADVERALYGERSLVKTWSLRGTLHLVPAGELQLWAAAVRGGPRVHDTHPILDALDGRALTRKELAEEVGDERLRSPWGEGLGGLASDGTICFGEPSGATTTFVRVDQWLGPQPEIDPDEARREVLRRYLRTYGPAKPADFRRWSGWDGDFSACVPVRVERTRAFLPPDDVEGFDADPTSVQLLPQYDAYVLGFRPREQLVPPAVKERVAADPKGRYESVTGMSPLLVDGVVTGFWKRDGAVEHVVPLPRGRKRELDAALARMREILG